MRFGTKHFRTFHRLYVGWVRQFSLGGRVVTCVLLLTAPQLMELGAPMFLLWSALFSLIVVAAVAASLWRPRLHVCYAIPEELVRREWTKIAVQVTNRSNRPAFQLSIGLEHLPPTWQVVSPAVSIPQLAGGTTQTVFVEIRADQRGKFAAPIVTIETVFPLGLVRNSATYSDRSDVSTYVVPALDRDLLAELTKQGREGSPMSLDAPVVSGDIEYVGSREYIPGIVPRRWDYACWARLGQPVVRTYADPCENRVALFVAHYIGQHAAADAQQHDWLEKLLSVVATHSYSHSAPQNRGLRLAVGGSLAAFPFEGA